MREPLDGAFDARNWKGILIRENSRDLGAEPTRKKQDFFVSPAHRDRVTRRHVKRDVGWQFVTHHGVSSAAIDL